MASADRLIELFNEANARSPGPERERFLAEHCPDDPELRAQVDSLLHAHAGAGSFLTPTGPILSASPAIEKPGDRIGRYRLLEQIGEGGCGVVYMADQEEPVRRRVALKVIKLGMDTREVIGRFDAERQALALMDHPNIAKVLDAGATETGRPFFVMELVRGTKITDYCDQHNLSTRDRLELFVHVCHAVQHAHQKGIIHRDLKPSNILVTEHDTVAVPKVIDFGIAKATSGPLTNQTLFTAFAQFMGTPAYMSPEQAQMSGLDIDTRTDIYSLGVLIYELLTGRPPFDPATLVASGLDEIRRLIREQDPLSPSTRLSTLNHADLSAVAAHRHIEPPRLVHLIRDDLDWIVMKCLEKDRTRRYDTAHGLAMDIQRHLHSEPVLARPPSAAYRFRKFARRNTAALGMATALALAALLTVVGLAVSNHRVTREKGEKEAALAHVLREKARADQNLLRARAAVKEYLLKTSENPLLQTGDFQPLRKELLETAIPFYEEFVRQDQEDPDVEFERGAAYDDLGFLRQGIGDEERSLADFEQAQNVFGRLAERFPDRSVYRLRLAEAHNGRGAVLKDLHRMEPAEREFRQALTLIEPLQSRPDAAAASLETQARIEGNLGILLRDFGRLPEAESALAHAVATRERRLDQQPDSLAIRGQLATSWNSLGSVLSAQRKSEDAERAFQKALDLLDPKAVKQFEIPAPMLLRFDHLRAQAWNNLGTIRHGASRLADAEAAHREALAIKEKLATMFPSVPQHRQELASTYNNLGTVISSLNRPDEAQAAYEKAIQLYETLADGAPDGTGYAVALAGTYSNLGRIIGDQGRLEESLPWMTKGIDLLEDALRRDPRVTTVRESLCTASWTRAMTLCGLDRYSQALEDWNRAIEMDDGHYHQPLRLRRASNLLNLNDHVRATADAAATAEFSAATAEDLYNAAGIHALSAQLAHDDAALADSYAARAVELLRQAVDKGYKDFERVRTHADLEALRSREDFQHLIRDLDAGPGK